MAVSNVAPTGELGATQQRTGDPRGWATFIDELEYVPELAWPASIPTYHVMRSDSQVEALHLGTTQPVREFRWSIDPNGATADLTERAARDFGIPVRGEEDDHVPISGTPFLFDEFLSDALLAPLYGFFHFEIVGAVTGDEWHLEHLAPRHPRTIADFQTDDRGNLTAIRQNIAGPGGWARTPPPITANRLMPFVWRSEAGSHVGRSMLRALYREWLVKDRTIRVAAINIERAGGVPVVEGPQGASDPQLAELAKLARQFKVAEGGGGAIPFGSKLHLVGGNTPDAISLLEYCDQAMARVWALMLLQLGTTATGSRALGGEFATFAARAHRAMANWIKSRVDRFLESYTAWNVDGARYAPRLHFEQSQPDALAVADFVALIEAGALHVDPELESWIRNERGLPAMPEPQTDPNLGDLTPEEVALVQNSRTPPPVPTPTPEQGPGSPGAPTPAAVPSVSTTARAARRPREVTAAIAAAAGVALPDRTLHRNPYDVEVRAAVNFRALDQAHDDVYARAEALYTGRVIPEQIETLAAGILNTRAGTERVRVTRSAMASLTAQPLAQAELATILADAARSGAASATQELASQGLVVEALREEDLAALVGEQANAVATMAANGISLAAQRRATSLVGGGRTPADVAAGVRAHLGGMTHQWTRDQLRGAVTMAQNAGRLAIFQRADPTLERGELYASELLDVNCCSPCTGIDGTLYPDYATAQQDYAAGGFVDCDGGPRCRGTLVWVSPSEVDLASRSDPFTAGLGG